MIPFFWNDICDYIPVLAGHIRSPVIMPNHDLSITRITACGNKSTAISGCFVQARTCFFFFLYLRNIIVSQFFQCIIGRDIQAIVIQVFCLETFHNSIDFIFVFPVKLIPEKIFGSISVKIPFFFGFMRKQVFHCLNRSVYIIGQ